MTAPELTVCPRCEGCTVEAMRWGGRSAADWIPVPCRDCCCSICGRKTDTPPVCARCDADEEAMAKRSADV